MISTWCGDIIIGTKIKANFETTLFQSFPEKHFVKLNTYRGRDKRRKTTEYSGQVLKCHRQKSIYHENF